MTFSQSVLILLALGTISSCTKVVKQKPETKSQDHFMTKNSPEKIKEVTDGNIRLRFMTRSAVSEMIAAGDIKPFDDKALRESDTLPLTPKANDQAAEEEVEDQESLLLGYPIELMGEQNIFGGVITKVSDRDNENLGRLKLTDLTPLHVKTVVTREANGSYLSLVGCADQCDETSVQQSLISFSIVGKDTVKNQLIVDLSEVGQVLNLTQILYPKSKETKLRPVSSVTTSFDYSLTTLTFDVKSKFIPIDRELDDPTAPVTEITARWYLKLSSGFNPAFTPRSPVKEVGFFETARTKDAKIMRHSLTSVNNKKIHYYVKNVPDAYKNNVKVAIDNWNAEFKNIVGREVISYEFMAENDSRNEKIVAGDVRFNVIEWDLDNMATYGGLGPSIANQYTGEIFATNTLLQGPKIVDLYSRWFKVSEQARALIADGREEEADLMMKKFSQKIQQQEKLAGQTSYRLSFGKIPMTIHSERAELEDPILKGLFEIVPEGMTFETYMPGYFQEMIQHELGHNLGLRHNFRGNLGSNESKTKGSVSRSIMEYLGRGYRYLNSIGTYDRMALAYGYKGILPTQKDWYCSDEHEAYDAKSILVSSPECSKADATPDPFSYWEGRLMRAIDIMVVPKTHRAPVLTLEHIKTEVDDLSSAYAGYALSAEKTAATWTNFFNKVDRPENVTEVKAYVMRSLTSRICHPMIAEAIAMKESPEAVKATQESYEALVRAMTNKMVELGLLKEKEKLCE